MCVLSGAPVGGSWKGQEWSSSRFRVCTMVVYYDRHNVAAAPRTDTETFRTFLGLSSTSNPQKDPSYLIGLNHSLFTNESKGDVTSALVSLRSKHAVSGFGFLNVEVDVADMDAKFPTLARDTMYLGEWTRINQGTPATVILGLKPYYASGEVAQVRGKLGTLASRSFLKNELHLLIIQTHITEDGGGPCLVHPTSLWTSNFIKGSRQPSFKDMWSFATELPTPHVKIALSLTLAVQRYDLLLDHVNYGDTCRGSENSRYDNRSFCVSMAVRLDSSQLSTTLVNVLPSRNIRVAFAFESHNDIEEKIRALNAQTSSLSPSLAVFGITFDPGQPCTHPGTRPSRLQLFAALRTAS